MNIEKLKELKTYLQQEDWKQDELMQRKKQFELENETLINELQELRTKISGCKEILKENAQMGYMKDGIKKRLGGIGIRVLKQLEYDEFAALRWAKQKDLFLQLDKKAFENVAKTGEIDFVEITDKITVTFPKEIKLEDC